MTNSDDVEIDNVPWNPVEIYLEERIRTIEENLKLQKVLNDTTSKNLSKIIEVIKGLQILRGDND